MRTATRIVRSNRDKLDAFAFALLRNEVLERSEIDAIMADVEVPESEVPGTGLRVVAADGTAG